VAVAAMPMNNAALIGDEIDVEAVDVVVHKLNRIL
jgi:hypothetical protein